MFIKSIRFARGGTRNASVQRSGYALPLFGAAAMKAADHPLLLSLASEVGFWGNPPHSLIPE